MISPRTAETELTDQQGEGVGDQLRLPPLAIGATRLTTVSVERDMQDVLALASEPANSHRYRSLGPGTTPSGLSRTLTDGVFAQFLVRNESSGQALGLVQAFVPDFFHGTVQIGALMSSAAHRRPWTMRAVVLFMNYVFQRAPFRKIYLEVPEFNFVTMSTGLARFFVYEGVLRNHEWHLGQYWHVHFLSLDRATFYSFDLVRRVLGDARV